jgi:cell division protein FtsB
MIDIERLDKLQRHARTIALLALAVFVVLIAVSLWSLWRVRGELRGLEQRKAEMTAQINQAQQEVQKLDEQRRALEVQREVLSQTISEIAARDPEPVKRALNATTASQLAAPQTEEEKKTRAYGQEAIRQLPLNSPRGAGSFKRIYLHIGNEKQRERAGQIAEQLKRAGYIVPGIENVSDRAPKGPTQLRCSWRNDTEREEALKIISLLQQWGVQMEPQPIKIAARPWQYEIWFGTEGLKPARAY